jgi:carbamoyltransferase
MIVIGIHNTGITSSAAVVVDGKLEFGCAEERLDRRKHSKYFPTLAIDACLDWIGADLNDVGSFAIAWNPAINIGSRLRPGHSEWPAYAGARFYSNPNHLLPQLTLGELTATEQIFVAADGRKAQITYVTHHLAHCANAFFLSGFDEAALFSCDAYGERASTVWATADGNDIKVLRQIRFPHSIGSFYSAITEFLGYRPDLDEWKVMGAAAYGDPARYRTAIGRLLHYGDDAEFVLDLKYFNHFDFDVKGLFSRHLVDLMGEPRRHDEPMTQRHFDIAAALQEAIECYLMTALRWLRQHSGKKRLCLTGGVLMNSVFNGKVAQSGLFDDVFIPYAPDDSGNSIGAALWVARRAGENGPGDASVASPFLGRDYSDVEIGTTLQRYHLKFRKLNDVPGTTAELLASGKVVGWFQGRMEFGQRALGARSILADPRNAGMKDRINMAVKYRESYRPFAPAVLAEAAADYFEGADGHSVSYMEKVFMVRPEKRDVIPAVVHADGSGRLQTVERAMNPLYYETIAQFGRRTGVPVVLNTSFNLNNEPIVESPSDAIRTFYTSGLDALVLGGYLLAKDGEAS